MRTTTPHPSSPAVRKTPVRHISQMGSDIQSPSAGYSRPTMSGSSDMMDTARMFELFENKAEVEILNSPADDKLAASMYGGLKKKKPIKKKKMKKGVSGYDFDSMIKDESSSSSFLESP